MSDLSADERVYPRETRAAALAVLLFVVVAVPSCVCGGLFVLAVLAR